MSYLPKNSNPFQYLSVIFIGSIAEDIEPQQRTLYIATTTRKMYHYNGTAFVELTTDPLFILNTFTLLQSYFTNDVLEVAHGGTAQNSYVDGDVLIGLTAGNTLSKQNVFNNNIVKVSNGGTGQSSYTDGQILIGNTTGKTLTKNTLTGTSNQVIITNGNGTITLSLPQNIHSTATPTFASLLSSNYIKMNIGNNDASRIAGGGCYLSWGDTDAITVSGNHGATCINNQMGTGANGGFLFRSFNNSNALISEPCYIGGSGGMTLANQLYNFESNASGIVSIKSHNTSTNAGTTKYITWLMSGKSTIGTDKDVGYISTYPIDADWVSSEMRFNIRNSDAIENNLTVRPSGITVYKGLTLTNGSMSISSNGSGSSFQGIQINNTYNSASNYKNCSIMATAVYNSQQKDIGAILWQANNDPTVANTNIYFGNLYGGVFSYPMVINSSGGVYIGPSNTNDHGSGCLTVENGIFLGATAYSNPDYCFEKYYTGDIVKFIDNKGAREYKIMTLEEIEQYTIENWNLPGVPDKKCIFERADILLEKTEELYIFMFQHNKKIKNLEEQNTKLQTSVEFMQNNAIMTDVKLNELEQENKQLKITNIELANSVMTLQSLVNMLSTRMDFLSANMSDTDSCDDPPIHKPY